jgi:hypothetical protein
MLSEYTGGGIETEARFSHDKHDFTERRAVGNTRKRLEVSRSILVIRVQRSIFKHRIDRSSHEMSSVSDFQIMLPS